jgi:hypothetical protein
LNVGISPFARYLLAILLKGGFPLSLSTLRLKNEVPFSGNVEFARRGYRR